MKKKKKKKKKKEMYVILKNKLFKCYNLKQKGGKIIF